MISRRGIFRIAMVVLYRIVCGDIFGIRVYLSFDPPAFRAGRRGGLSIMIVPALLRVIRSSILDFFPGLLIA